MLEGSGSRRSVGAGEVYTDPDGCLLCRGYGFWFGDEHDPVPPGTEVLVMRVNWSNGAPTADAAGAAPWVQVYDGGGGFQFRSVEATRQNDTEWTYVLPIHANRTDGMYVENRSRWWFLMGFEGAEDTGVDDPVFWTDVTSPWTFDGDWRFEVRAYNTTDLPGDLSTT